MHLWNSFGALFNRDRRAAKRVRYAVVDLETTGLEPATSNIIEIAIIELDAKGKITAEWSSLLNPPGDGELGATQIHGITRAMVDGAPQLENLADEISELLIDHVIVGHVIAFDLSHLTAEFARISRPLPDLGSVSICTRELARQFMASGPRTLNACCESASITLSNAHSALGDTRATAELFAYFLDRIKLKEIAMRTSRLSGLSWSQPPLHIERAAAQPRVRV